MPQSHLLVRHLLRQLDQNDREPARRLELPAEIRQLVVDISELFEPIRGISRVGFECVPSEEGWELSMYLGAVEVVGGAADGARRNAKFRLDLRALLSRFEAVESFVWTVLPDLSLTEDELENLSFVTVVGTVGGQVVRLQLHSEPPATCSPGLRELPSGEFEPV